MGLGSRTSQAEHLDLAVAQVQHILAGALLVYSILWGLAPAEPCPALSGDFMPMLGGPTSFGHDGQEFDLWNGAAWLQLLSLSSANWVRLGKDLLFVLLFSHL